jgi:hypothetical protein
MNTPTWIMAIGTGLYTAATIVLVVVTWRNLRLVRRYTDLTKRMVEEMQESRRTVVRPMLVPVFQDLAGADKYFQGIQLYWGVENIGTGPAVNVDVTLRYGSSTKRLQRHLIRPGETRMVRDGEGYRARLDLRDSQDYTVYLDGNYHDLFGQRIQAKEELPVSDRWQEAPAGQAPEMRVS